MYVAQDTQAFATDRSIDRELETCFVEFVACVLSRKVSSHQELLHRVLANRSHEHSLLFSIIRHSMVHLWNQSVVVLENEKPKFSVKAANGSKSIGGYFLA